MLCFHSCTYQMTEDVIKVGAHSVCVCACVCTTAPLEVVQNKNSSSFLLSSSVCFLLLILALLYLQPRFPFFIKCVFCSFICVFPSTKRVWDIFFRDLRFLSTQNLVYSRWRESSPPLLCSPLLLSLAPPGLLPCAHPIFSLLSSLQRTVTVRAISMDST